MEKTVRKLGAEPGSSDGGSNAKPPPLDKNDRRSSRICPTTQLFINLRKEEKKGFLMLEKLPSEAPTATVSRRRWNLAEEAEWACPCWGHFSDDGSR